MFLFLFYMWWIKDIRTFEWLILRKEKRLRPPPPEEERGAEEKRERGGVGVCLHVSGSLVYGGGGVVTYLPAGISGCV